MAGVLRSLAWPRFHKHVFNPFAGECKPCHPDHWPNGDAVGEPQITRAKPHSCAFVKDATAEEEGRQPCKKSWVFRAYLHCVQQFQVLTVAPMFICLGP